MSIKLAKPIISGFNPDPSICRVGEAYYVVCSSFEYFPGVPVYRSEDLQSWTHIGNVLDRLDQLDVREAQPSQGVFATTIRHHGDRFWIITTNVPGSDSQLLVHAQKPEGPWSKAVEIPGIPGIDPDLAWDESGNCHVTYSGYSPKSLTHGICQVPVDLEAGSTIGEPAMIWKGTGGAYPEGPHLYRVGGWWYLMISEGGTERCHSVTIARSRNIDGPYEENPGNPILSMRGTTSPVQNAGHADLVERADGTWAMVFLGVRPAGATPMFHVLGRETFAVEISWVDGWPVPTRAINPTEPTDENSAWTFDDGRLGPEWFAPAESDLGFAHPDSEAGSVAVHAAEGEEEGQSRTLAQRLRHLRATIATTVDSSSGTGGLVLRLDERHQYSIEAGGARVVVRARVGGLDVDVATMDHRNGRVRVRMEIVKPDTSSSMAGPDEIAFFVQPETEGGWAELARLDGRYLSTEVAGGFTGRVFGLLARSGTVVFSDLRYIGRDV